MVRGNCRWTWPAKASKSAKRPKLSKNARILYKSVALSQRLSAQRRLYTSENKKVAKTRYRRQLNTTRWPKQRRKNSKGFKESPLGVHTTQGLCSWRDFTNTESTNILKKDTNIKWQRFQSQLVNSLWIKWIKVQRFSPPKICSRLTATFEALRTTRYR